MSAANTHPTSNPRPARTGPGLAKVYQKKLRVSHRLLRLTMLALGAASRFGKRRFFCGCLSSFLSLMTKGKEYDMLKKLCTIKVRLPRPQPLETTAIINLFLETLPQNNSEDLTLDLNEAQGTYIHPSQEFQGETWLATTSTSRWDDDPTAIEWAYNTLENLSIIRFQKVLHPFLSLDKGHTYAYFYHLYTHQYHVTHQESTFSIGTLFPGNTDSFYKGEILQEEVKSLFYVIKEPGITPSSYFLWFNSFLELSEKWPSQLAALLSQVNNYSPKFAAYSTNGANHIGRIVERCLRLTLPEGTTDAELLNAILPWGGRTRLICHESKGGNEPMRFNFCYIKPIQEYPPIRVEIPAKIPLEEVDSLLDKVMAHVILNPDVL